MEFENGIIGISETGFMSCASPEIFEIYGHRGYAIRHGDDVKLYSTKLAPFTKEWIRPTLPRRRSSAAASIRRRLHK